MPLIDTLKKDENFKKVQVGERFNRLPPPQKLAVLAMLKGKQHEFDDVGRQFTSDPLFQEMYSNHFIKPRPRFSGQDKFAHMSGLMQTIRQFIGDPEDDEESLNPEYAERVGGSSSMKFDSPFDMKFASAFQTEGARGLAKLHKSMLNSVEYQQFLDGVE